MPAHYLGDGQQVRVGGRRRDVLATPGHTRRHVCFFEQATQLLFINDRVLRHIMPSSGFEPQPTSHALHDPLTSLACVLKRSQARVLPTQGGVFADPRGRGEKLAQHHAQRLGESFDVLADGAATWAETARTLHWTRRQMSFSDLNPFNQMLATLETLAHLELLESQVTVTRTQGPVWEFGSRRAIRAQQGQPAALQREVTEPTVGEGW